MAVNNINVMFVFRGRISFGGKFFMSSLLIIPDLIPRLGLFIIPAIWVIKIILLIKFLEPNTWWQFTIYVLFSSAVSKVGRLRLKYRL